MVKPNKNLKDFIGKYCNDIPFDSPVILFRLLEKINTERKNR